MRASSLLIFGVAVLSISPINCIGTAFIENRCSFKVYVWSVANVPNDTMNTLAPVNGKFSETYRTNPNGGGISLKIATVPVDLYITQFEYAYLTDNPFVYYDISNVNGTPFQAWGLALSPSTPTLSLFTPTLSPSTPTLSPGIPTCGPISCDPGVALCPEVYNKPNDDYVMQQCDLSINLTLTLCPFNAATATEPVAATITTTDSDGSAVLSTLTTSPIPAESTTILPSQTRMVTGTGTTLATTMATDSEGRAVLSTAPTPTKSTTIPPSQTRMVTATGTTLATTMATDSEGRTVLSTAPTTTKSTTIPPSQTRIVTATGTTLATTMTTDSECSTCQTEQPLAACD
jgi:hypothetical protein